MGTTMGTIMSTDTIIATMTEPGFNGAALYRMLAWLSPAYPIGAFSYSHGVEYAVEAGLVADLPTLVGWVAHVARRGSGWTDAVFFARACDAVLAGDMTQLDEVAALAAAWRGTSEMALESLQQGDAFLRTTRAAWPDPRLDELAARWTGRPLALPVAVAVACAGHLDVQLALTGYLHAFTANLVSAGVRLIPLGQTDGQRALAELAPIVAAIVPLALATPIDDLGSAAPMVDWTSMQHETQYTRLFRS